jgi:hypothetical protein
MPLRRCQPVYAQRQVEEALVVMLILNVWKRPQENVAQIKAGGWGPQAATDPKPYLNGHCYPRNKKNKMAKKTVTVKLFGQAVLYFCLHAAHLIVQESKAVQERILCWRFLQCTPSLSFFQLLAQLPYKKQLHPEAGAAFGD